MNTYETKEFDVSLLKILAPYRIPDTKRSLWQMANTIIPYIGLWFLMFISMKVSYWLTLALSIPTAGFMVRSFIIFHDCGHGSFFSDRRANEIAGIITGILTLTPWTRWWHNHAVHHATAGDLDRRGVGDVYVMTVKEYRESNWIIKLGYRLMRNPVLMFFIGGPFIFALINRIPIPGTGKRERQSIFWTNMALAIIITILCITQGWKAYLLVQLPILILGSSTGIWLFYVQHQFEGVYWKRHGEWNFFEAGLKGSSYFKLPRVLQWFTGNIGFHHIHHLSSKIPNYRVNKCLRDNPDLQNPPTLTLLTSLRSLRLRLYDEDAHQLVGWKS
jgi:omega-6 fatty acid desaturase (delta-12 desaturase)